MRSTLYRPAQGSLTFVNSALMLALNCSASHELKHFATSSIACLFIVDYCLRINETCLKRPSNLI